MKYILDGFGLPSLTRHFEDIAAIPHGSGSEKALGDHIMSVAKDNGLESIRDEAGNIIVKLPASSGFEGVAPVLIQGHIDMVLVKDDGVDIDMEHEGVRLVLEGNILRADGTTLGADNAVGICNMLALMQDRSVVHPPLELLFTVSEETGLVGVRQFDMTGIASRRMINMDCGDPDCMTIGSAGSAKYKLQRKCDEKPFAGMALRVEIKGLLGGHSGIEAGKNRASAVELAARLLSAMCDAAPVRLAAMECRGPQGGIPREIEFTVGFDGAGLERIKAVIAHMDAVFAAETAVPDPGYHMSIADAQAHTAMSEADTRTIADLMLLAPYDVSRRSTRNYAWPLCSALMTGTTYSEGLFRANFSIRANMDEYLEACEARFKALMRIMGARYTETERNPAWPDDANSPLQTLCMKVYERMYGGPMKQEIEHGVVEVSVIKKALPDMDIAGFAPKSRGAHTTNEHLYVDTLIPFWRYLTAVLEAMCHEA